MSTEVGSRWRTAGVFGKKAWNRMDLPAGAENEFIEVCRSKLKETPGPDLIRYMDWLVEQTTESMLGRMAHAH